MYNLSAVGVCKMDTWYIPEWIAYHRLLGIEGFLMISFDKDPAIRAEMTALSQQFDFELRFENFAWGSSVYNNLQPYIKSYTKWCAYIDCDEFIYLPEGGTLTEMLREYEEYGGLSMSWRCYGSSDLEKRQELTTESFVYRAKDSFLPNAHQKIIVQTKYLGAFNTPHFAETDEPLVDENFDVVPWVLKSGHPIRSANRVRVNHYLLRSKEDYENKKKRASDVGGLPPTYWDESQVNEVYDDGICRYAQDIRYELNRYPKPPKALGVTIGKAQTDRSGLFH